MSYHKAGKLVNYIFPARCIFCRRSFEPQDDSLICRRCLGRYGSFGGKSALLPGGMGQCAYALSYRGEVRSAVLRYKFGGKAQYAKTLARFLTPLALPEDGYDFVTWVPISMLRRIRRTYDQSRLLAAFVARQYGLRLVRVLRKRRHNRAQSKVGAAQRAENVKGVCTAVNGDMIRGARILLVDDVVTTGSTLAECTRILYEAGARSVKCIALAHG